jgi:hypothetical protein
VEIRAVLIIRAVAAGQAGRGLVVMVRLTAELDIKVQLRAQIFIGVVVAVVQGIVLQGEMVELAAVAAGQLGQQVAEEGWMMGKLAVAELLIVGRMLQVEMLAQIRAVAVAVALIITRIIRVVTGAQGLS